MHSDGVIHQRADGLRVACVNLGQGISEGQGEGQGQDQEDRVRVMMRVGLRLRWKNVVVNSGFLPIIIKFRQNVNYFGQKRHCIDFIL